MHVQTSTTAPLHQIFEPNKFFSFVSKNNSRDVNRMFSFCDPLQREENRISNVRGFSEDVV